MIPVENPAWLGTEIQRITEVVTGPGHVAGCGPIGRRERLLAQPALRVPSCTHALETAGLDDGA